MSATELPKPKKGTRCAALDMDGKQCRLRGVVLENYHGEGEFYDFFSGRPSWVRVAFCEDHKERD